MRKEEAERQWQVRGGTRGWGRRVERVCCRVCTCVHSSCVLRIVTTTHNLTGLTFTLISVIRPANLRDVGCAKMCPGRNYRRA